jgi:hypothetical protein
VESVDYLRNTDFSKNIFYVELDALWLHVTGWL